MEKPEIMKTLVANLKQVVPDLDEAEVSPEKSMIDLGANSLDIVDVVSTTMRQLKVKIPRDQLSTITSVGGLVDALHAAQGM